MNGIIECSHCGKKIDRPVKEINRIKNRGGNAYCSVECESKYKFEHTRKEVSCFNCGKRFLIKNCNAKKSNTQKFFCCSSCAATYNNRGRKKPDHIKRKISASMKKHYQENRDSLFWIQSEEKISDWFVVSDSGDKALEFHNHWEDKKFNKEELKAIRVKRLRKDYRDADTKGHESFYATDDVLSRIGFEVVSKKPVEVRYKGYMYKEGLGRQKIKGDA